MRRHAGTYQLAYLFPRSTSDRRPCEKWRNLLYGLALLLPDNGARLSQGSVSQNRKGCAQAGVQISADAGSPFPTIQSVIAENERIVKALDSILQCSCSQDGYLITVVSLVVFKVLDWYAAAGRAAPTVTTADSYIPHPFQIQTRSSSHFADSLCSDGENYGENSGRVAAQMVLSELHRAQRLVNELSARFKGQGTGGAEVEVGASTNTPNGTHNAIDMLCDGEGTWPFSTTMLDQLEANLRGRLRIVSLRIVDMIRQA